VNSEKMPINKEKSARFQVDQKMPMPMDHVTNMLHSFLTLPSMPFTDLTIQIEDSSIRLHSILLGAFSPMISSMLSPLPHPTPHPFLPGAISSSRHIVLANVDKNSLPLFRELLYTGICRGSLDEMKEVMMVMQILGMKEQLMLDELVSNLTSDTLELFNKVVDDSVEIQEIKDFDEHYEMEDGEDDLKHDVILEELDGHGYATSHGSSNVVSVNIEDTWVKEVTGHVRLFESESNLNEELVVKKKRDHDHAWDLGLSSGRQVCSDSDKVRKSKRQRKKKHDHFKDEGDTDKNVLFCPHCHKKFGRLIEKEMHALIEHSYEQPYKCKECAKRFKLKEEIKEHMNVHVGGKFQIQCEICDKVFNSMMLYFSHYKSHSKFKEFGCTKCGKCFYTFKGLKKHSILHMSKRFRCIVCGKMFHRQYDMKKHHQKQHLK